MPGGDGTGPAGMGPMTGRGAGYCAGFELPGYANNVPRRYAGAPAWTDNRYPAGAPGRNPVNRPGTGRGIGRGRGRRGWT